MGAYLGPLIFDLSNSQLESEEIDILKHPLINGVILFSRNYESPQQLKDLCAHIKSVNSNCLIMTDQEGGRVQRFKADFKKLPPLRSLGERYQQDKASALSEAYRYGQIMSAELLEHGVDLSLAPVLDLDRHTHSVIGDRAFHSDPQIVTDLARAYILGMRSTGMAITAKHFPGHGGVQLDSHLSMPIDYRSYSEISHTDLLPYSTLIKEKLISAVMTAHITFPKIDSPPATFSRTWLQTILREKMSFQGVILSDDLNMQGAATGDYVHRMSAAINAGCDLIMLCNNRPAIREILEKIESKSYLIPEAKWEIMRPVRRTVPIKREASYEA